MGTDKLKEYLKYHKGVTKEWLIENLIPLGEVVILYAPTNQYKTFLSLKIAFEVLTGSQELGVTKTGNVTIFSPDTAWRDMILRIRGLTTAKYQENKERYLSMPLDILYSEYLGLILNKKDKTLEDKFYIILKDTLKKYETSPSRHIKYSQKRIYDLLNIKKNYMDKYDIKN